MRIKHTPLLIALIAVASILSIAWPTPGWSIVNGQDAQAGRWRSVVGLVIGEQELAIVHYCAGTLIAPTWVLTASHCVRGLGDSQLNVVSGVYALDQLSGTERIEVVQVIIHPEANVPELNADIALLRLSSASSAPIATISGYSRTYTGQDAIVLGWGYTRETGGKSNVLQRANLPVVSNQACQQAYLGLQNIFPSMICAGGVFGGAGTCNQDSGGPLYVSLSDKDVLIGITSFGEGCAIPAYYSGFARVSALLDFILLHVPEAQLYQTAREDLMPPILFLLQ